MPLPSPSSSPGPDAARARFPRGLLQPEHAFRFSRDALLLADFAAGLDLPPAAAALDLGAGCGVAGLALLLRRPDVELLIGVERDVDLAGAARLNARRLGLARRYAVVCGDLGASSTLRAARAEHPSAPSDGASFALALCNPPWRREGTGRTPPSPARRAALFGSGETFPLFFGAADRLLALRGALALVCGAECLAEVFAALPKRLRPVRLRFVHARANDPAVFFLLEARKGSKAALRVEAPLILEYGP